MSAPSDFRKPLPGFLNLGPVTSGGFPHKQQQAQTGSVETETRASSNADGTTSATATAAAPTTTTTTARRSSSVSTTNSNAPALRFLKLGPVHFGEHQDSADQEDWSSAVAE